MFKRSSLRSPKLRRLPSPSPLLAVFSWLAADKAPLYVTLFFAALTWTFVRTIDQLASTPFVEYQLAPDSQDFAEAGGQRVLGVRLRNMSGPKPVDCITVYVFVRRGELEFRKVFIPVLRGPVFSLGRPATLEKRKAALYLNEFPPGADIEFGLQTAGQGEPGVQARACEGEKGRMALPAIVERSFQTWLIAHQLPVLWCGLGAWGILVCVIPLIRARSGKRSPR